VTDSIARPSSSSIPPRPTRLNANPRTPAGGETAAILVVPARHSASVRVLTANLDPDLVEWDPGEGLEVVRVV
jgi:hypothetical protein